MVQATHDTECSDIFAREEIILLPSYLQVVDSFKEMEESYKDVCQMFGEQHKSTEPDEFFKIFANFADKFRVSEILTILTHLRLRVKSSLDISGMTIKMHLHKNNT